MAKAKSFLEIIKNLTYGETDIPKDFCDAVSYQIISATLGRFYIQPNLMLRPNLYQVVCAPPQISRRGTLMNVFNTVCDSALYTYGTYLNKEYPVYKKANKKGKESKETEEKEKVDQIILLRNANKIGGGSGEGWVDFIGYAHNKYRITAFNASFDEFGHMLTAMTNKGKFESTTFKIIIKMYRGEGHTEYFSRRESEKTTRTLPEGLYFTLFGTMQKPDNYIKDSIISSTGFLRRFIIDSKSGEEVIKRFKPGLDLELMPLFDTLHKIGSDIGEEMIRLHEKEDNGELIEISVDDDFHKAYTRIEKEVRDKAGMNEDSPYYQFLTGKAEQIMKRSMLRAIADGRTKLNKDDFTISKKYIDRATKSIQETLEDTELSRKEKIRKKRYNEVIRGIKKKKKKNSTELLQYCNCNTKEMNEHIAEAYRKKDIDADTLIKYVSFRGIILQLITDGQLNKSYLEKWEQIHKTGRKSK